PHDAIAAVFADVFVKAVGGFDFADDRRAGRGFQNVAREDHQEFVAVNDAAGFINEPDAVGVAVKTEAEVRLFRADLLDELLEIGVNGRIRVMVWEAAVELAKERDDLRAEIAEEFGRHGRGRSVSGVKDDLLAI